MHKRFSLFGVGRLVAATLSFGFISACGYTSQYQAPADGRARVVWGADNDPVVELAGAQPDDSCAATLQQTTGYKDMQTTAGSVELASASAPTGYSMAVGGGYWVPRYYGSPIIVARPGIAPLFLRPPLFSPSLSITSAILRSRGGGIGGIGSVRSSGGAVRLGGGGGGGGGRMDGAAMVLVALAVMALPAIDIGLAAATPESSSKSSRAIDLVNAYNDLMRSPGSPCSLYAMPAPGMVMPSPDPSQPYAPGGVQ